MTHLQKAYALGADRAAQDFNKQAEDGSAARTVMGALSGGTAGLYLGEVLKPVLIRMKLRGLLGNAARAAAPYTAAGLGVAGAGLGAKTSAVTPNEKRAGIPLGTGAGAILGMHGAGPDERLPGLLAGTVGGVAGSAVSGAALPTIVNALARKRVVTPGVKDLMQTLGGAAGGFGEGRLLRREDPQGLMDRLRARLST